MTLMVLERLAGVALSQLEVVDRGEIIGFTYADALKYHGMLAPGGVAVFFCGGPLPPGPITRPACPAFGTISGTWHAEDIVGPTSQGVDPANPNNENAFERLIRAIRSGRAYANVHSTRSPAGEIRGQLVRADDDNDNESHDR